MGGIDEGDYDPVTSRDRLWSKGLSAGLEALQTRGVEGLIFLWHYFNENYTAGVLDHL